LGSAVTILVALIIITTMIINTVAVINIGTDSLYYEAGLMPIFSIYTLYMQ